MYFIKLFSIFVLYCSCIYSTVRSTTGEIKFDSNSDGLAEVTLKSSGLGLGVEDPSSTFDLHGSFGLNVELVSSNVVLSNNTMILAETSSDNLPLTLPDANTVSGRTYVIKKKSRNNHLWVTASDNIEGEDSQMLLEDIGVRGQPYIWFYSDGEEWFVINQSEENDWVVGSDNLVAWWKLDELSGTHAEDVIPTHFSAELQGGFTFSGCTQSGLSGGALSFDGVNDYATAPSEINSYIYEEITISAWVLAEDSDFGSVFESFVTEAYSGDGVVKFALAGNHSGGSSTKVGAGFYDGSWHSVNQSGAFTFGQWVHVVATYDGSEIKLYLDGVLDNMTSDAAGLPNGTEDWRIGRRHDSGNYHQGKLDDIRIYNKALAASQIQTLYLQHR